jgi:hypothetical protein
VYDEGSPTLDKALHRSGCDLVLQRPLNPHTFRLLAAQALYEGPERRMGERRAAARKSFTQRVFGAGAGISQMLIGRDLSAGGMRVRPEPDLELGDEIKLAVYGRPGQPAIMLKAVVTRDDGDDGLVLRFHDVPTSIAARLEQIVAELPTLPIKRVKSPAASPAQPGVVVSELFGRR